MVPKINSSGHKALSNTNSKYNKLYISTILLSEKWKMFLQIFQAYILNNYLVKYEKRKRVQ